MTKRTVGAYGLKSVLMCGVMLAAVPAGAQEALEEIIVTAQKRAQNLQEVPVSVTALSGETLLNAGVQDVMDLGKLAPGLQITATDAAANPKIFIRGVGLSDFNANASGAVGIYVDGAYVASPLAQMGQFFDVAQVEVLRGPQGTLYGRNTTGGAINITTRRPDFTPSIEGRAEYGRYDALTLDAAVGGGVVEDRLALRLAGTFQRDDGPTLNRVSGDHVNATDRWALRGSALFTPGETVEVLLQLRGGRSTGDAIHTQARALQPAVPEAAGPDGLCRPELTASGLCTDALGYADTDGDPYAGDYNLEGKDKIDLAGATLNLRWSGDALTLYSITAFDYAKRDDEEDTDASPNSLLHTWYEATQRDFSQEFRGEAEFGAVKAVAGVYYLHDYLDTDSGFDVLRDLRPLFITPDNPTGLSIENNVALVGYPYRQTTDSYAAFGQADWQATDRLTLTAGLRYSHDKKDFRYRSTLEREIELFALEDDKPFGSLSGRLGAQVALTDTAMAYASYNRGYKSGGFFGGYTRDPADLAPYEDEVVDAYEIGTKTEWLDGRLRLNLSGFYYDYQDLQVFQLVERAGLPVQTFDNAASARIKGLDFELMTVPLSGLELGLSGEYLDATYRDYRSQGQDLEGNRLPSSPRWSLTGSARYSYPIDGFGAVELAANVSYRSKVYFDSNNVDRLSQGSLWLADLTLGWSSSDGSLGAGLMVNNLFDKDYVVDINPLESFGLDAVVPGRPCRLSGYVRWQF
ncbi:TonB-dependent receptor [Oleisolibacter albus]|uniref:TonB-dependent receptor n=1 Tax=Oleisolibacter albus TaxID=2171757 RepID=UPI001960D5D4|nr:TonB-dependent receptor [Oleisolibacter albus]